MGNYSKVARTPAFLLAEGFARMHGISFKKFRPAGNVPTVSLSYSAISEGTGGELDRDGAHEIIKEMLRRVGEVASTSNPIKVDLGFSQVMFQGGQCKVLYDQLFMQQVDRPPRSSRQNGLGVTAAQSPESRSLLQQPGAHEDELPRPNSACSVRTNLSTWTNPALRMPPRPDSPSACSEASVRTVRSMRSISAEPAAAPVHSSRPTCTCDACLLRSAYNEQIHKRVLVRRQEQLLDTKIASDQQKTAQAQAALEQEQLELKRRARMEVEEYNRELSKLKARERYRAEKLRKENLKPGKLTFETFEADGKRSRPSPFLPSADELRATLSEQVVRKQQHFQQQIEETRTFYQEQQRHIAEEVQSELEAQKQIKREKQRLRQQELDDQIHLRNQVNQPLSGAYSFGTDFAIHGRTTTQPTQAGGAKS